MKQVLLPALISCLLFSCGKHNDKPDNPGGTPGPTPTAVLRIKSSNGFNYTYDGQGRLSQSFYSNSIPARMEYTYTETTVTGTDFGTDGKPFGERIKYTIGPNGLATGDKYIVGANSTSLITTYTYNTERQLVEEIAGEEGKTPTVRTIHYYSKGNRDSIKSFSLLNDKLLTYMRFEYYTDKPNLLSYENNGISYLGASSVNLMKKYVLIEPGDTTVAEFTYEFDAQKRPARSHMIQNGVPFSDATYTYF
jgi:hypothetical protein